MATETRLKFSEFIDLILARLYELEESARPGVLFDLNEIAQELTTKVPPQWVFDAGKVLEARGLAQVAFAFGGSCHAQLTGEGRLFVEEERGTGIIRRYHDAPTNYVSVSGSGNQIIVGTTGDRISQTMTPEKERQPAFKLLDQMKDALRSDASLTDDERRDVLADVDMIEQQLRKRDPNRPALAALLEPLSKIASIGGLVADLIRLFNP